MDLGDAIYGTCMKDSRKRSDYHSRSETNTKMLIIVVEKGDIQKMVPPLKRTNQIKKIV
jgi:uncharacterized protein YlbG (UPF0298 family)